eukprot:2098646-Rhodomonas_salina.5
MSPGLVQEQAAIVCWLRRFVWTGFEEQARLFGNLRSEHSRLRVEVRSSAVKMKADVSLVSTCLVAAETHFRGFPDP